VDRENLHGSAYSRCAVPEKGSGENCSTLARWSKRPPAAFSAFGLTNLALFALEGLDVLLYASAFSLPAALLDDLFDHLAKFVMGKKDTLK
jgi:hypothetical protein